MTMYQFSITRLLQDCYLSVVFMTLRVETLCAVPIRLPISVAGATWDLQLWMTDVVK